MFYFKLKKYFSFLILRNSPFNAANSTTLTCRSEEVCKELCDNIGGNNEFDDGEQDDVIDAIIALEDEAVIPLSVGEIDRLSKNN